MDIYPEQVGVGLTGAAAKCRACGEVVGCMGKDIYNQPSAPLPVGCATRRRLWACPLCGADWRKGDGSIWQWWEGVEVDSGQNED